MRSYRTFNRVIWFFPQTVRLIESYFYLVQCCQEQIKQTPFYVKIDCFWARDLISCVKGYFWPTWRWVNSFFDFCPFPQTFLTFFESPKKPKLPFFELGTWFFVWREVFDQHEHGSNHFLISALLHSKIALWSWAVQYIKWGLLDLFLAALYVRLPKSKIARFWDCWSSYLAFKWDIIFWFWHFYVVKWHCKVGPFST